MTTISFKTNIPLRSQDVSSLFIASGIKRPVNDLERIQKMIDNSNLTISAWDQDTLIGLARAVTDFSYCCYFTKFFSKKPNKLIILFEFLCFYDNCSSF